eukprot:13249406-Alexandrium_andersonii.AAC.1
MDTTQWRRPVVLGACSLVLQTCSPHVAGWWTQAAACGNTSLQTQPLCMKRTFAVERCTHLDAVRLLSSA